MKYLLLVSLAALAVVMGGCPDAGSGGSGGGFTQACDDSSSVELAGDVSPTVAVDDPDKANSDESVKALDLVGTPTVTIVGTTLTCTLIVDDIPADESLTVYHTELSQGSLNYQWAVNFDVDGDGADDYILALSLFNGSLAEQDGSIGGLMQSNLWQKTGTTTSKIADAPLTIVSDNSLAGSNDLFTMTVTDPAVANLVSAQEVYAATVMNNGRFTYRDCRQITTQL